MTEKTIKPRTAKPKKETGPEPKSAAKKPRVVKKVEETTVEDTVLMKQEEDKPDMVFMAVEIPSGKYIYATGRRKRAVANVRVFAEKGEHTANKKPLSVYFPKDLVEKALSPFKLIGQASEFKVYANISGGGINAQSEAVRHGIAQALGKANEEVRKLMKKNGLLTRDDRRKERKKPGLKRARRSPQWAKR